MSVVNFDVEEQDISICFKAIFTARGEALDVRLVRNNLAAARANLSQRERVERTLTRGLEALLGRYPAGALAPPASLPDVSRRSAMSPGPGTTRR